MTNPQGEPPVKPTVYAHALAHRDPFTNRSLHRTQFGQFDGGVQQVDPVPGGSAPLAGVSTQFGQGAGPVVPQRGWRRMDRRD